MKDFLLNPLHNEAIQGIFISPANIILMVLVVFGAIIFKKLTRKYLRKGLDKSELPEDIKKRIIKIAGQLVYFIAGYFFIKCISAGNPDFDLGKFFDFTLIKGRVDSDGNGFRLTVKSIFYLVLLYFIIKICLSIVRSYIYKSLSAKEWVDEGKSYTIFVLVKYFLWVIAAIFALYSVGMDIDFLVASSAALLVGISLGLQNFFADIMSGFILLFEGSVKVGDIVEVDDITVRVKKINIRSSIVMSKDGNAIIVPNSKFTQEKVVNWTHSEKVARFVVTVGVKYGSDTEKVRDLLYQCALNHPQVDKQKNIVVNFKDFADSSLNFELFFWASRTWEIEVIQSDLRFAISKAFNENAIEIPFPQRDLHIVSDVRNSTN